jgi:hypothetical protein
VAGEYFTPKPPMLEQFDETDSATSHSASSSMHKQKIFSSLMFGSRIQKNHSFKISVHYRGNFNDID